MLGPVMLDLKGPALSPVERERLEHPLAGGVILFSRNYADPAQLAHLVAEIHAVRTPPLLVAVDHEGGRVQRFRAGFTPLPAAGALGRVYDRDPTRALALARTSGWVMAAELRIVGVDLSFAPVLDLDYGVSRVIGDRAFHRDPEVVATLAGAYIDGMGRAGMAATGKHFPGHGGVEADSHVALPVDERDLEAIGAADMLPFARLAPRLGGVMPAHVVYRQVDARPAGFSRLWLQEILRARLGFRGLVFSDDLSMEGAKGAGDVVERAHAAFAAGCDAVLVCNDPGAAERVLDRLGPAPRVAVRMDALHARGRIARADLLASREHREAAAALAALA